MAKKTNIKNKSRFNGFNGQRSFLVTSEGAYTGAAFGSLKDAAEEAAKWYLGGVVRMYTLEEAERIVKNRAADRVLQALGRF
jgi:hypothetical protein